MEVDLEQEKLGELLVERGVISQDELDRALEFQENDGGKLGNVLVQLDLVTDEEVIEAVAEQQNLEIVDLSELILPQELIEKIPRDIIEKHEVIPIGLEGNKLRLAIHDPFDLDSIEKVGLATDYHIEPVLASRDSILQAINDLFYQDDEGDSDAVEEAVSTDSVSESSIQDTQEQRTDVNTEDIREEETDLSKYDASQLIQAVAQVLTRNDIITEEELMEELEER